MSPGPDGKVDLDDFFEANPESPRPEELGDIDSVAVTFVPVNPEEPMTAENAVVDLCVHPGTVSDVITL